MRTLLPCLLLVSSVQAEGVIYTTNGRLNGQEWVAFSYEQKLLFVAGVWEGVKHVLGALKDAKLQNLDVAALADCYLPDDVSTGQMVETLDILYKPVANRTIPIIAMEIFASSLAQGSASEESNRASLLKLRKRYPIADPGPDTPSASDSDISPSGLSPDRPTLRLPR